MAEASAIPLNPSMEHVAMRSTAEVDVYEIGYDSLDGLRIAGWYCRPKESYLPPPYPALLIVPGYISEPTLPKSWAKMGYAAVGVAPRGKLRSNLHYNPGYPGLLVNNIVDRHTYSYRGFYIDACRAVDFVLTRTLAYVDPVHHAAGIRSTTLFSVGTTRLDGREWLEPLMNACSGPVEQYMLSHEGATDHDWLDGWMAQRLGAEPKPRSWQVA